MMNNSPLTKNAIFIPHQRYLAPYILEDLSQKMVFVGGPRQVGKTTLCRSLFTKDEYLYLNWDELEDRQEILNYRFSKQSPLIIFDELHKYRLWRTIVKGLFDKYHPDLRILVTGSARLDHYRKGGDSLLGRYHYHRLHPFTLAELVQGSPAESVKMLMQFGGFPEPLFKQSSRHLKRWQRERIQRVVSEDLRDLEQVKDISRIELLIQMLYPRVSAPLSIKSIQEDLEVSPASVDKWITILEQLYFCYRIYPWGTNRLKAVKKRPKLYLWDWSELTAAGPKFENFVASHLLKFCHHLEDTEGDSMELCYLQDVEGGKELDFIVIKNKKPLFAVECKTGERSLSPSLSFYQKKLNIPKVYQVHLGTKDTGHEERGGRLLPFERFSQEVQLV